MTSQMPRGAIPTPRSELAAAEPYRPGGTPEIFVPSGEFPSPNHELASARPYRAGAAAPESFIAWPIGVDSWAYEEATGAIRASGAIGASSSIWAEEAFAKACAEPRVFIPPSLLLATSQAGGLANFAEFMQTHGFQTARTAYLNGPFYAVDWTDTATLHGAIAGAGPVKTGIASANLASGPHGQVTAGTSGWAIYGLPPSQLEDSCASLCGYGQLAALIDLFQRQGIDVELPPGMPAGLCYAMFARDSLGIIDRQSLVNIAGEAWVRDPTTIAKDIGE